MALAASVHSLASEIRSLCDSSDPTKRTLHAFSSKMSALLPVVRGFDSAEGDSDEARSVMTKLRKELEEVRTTVRSAADMSRAAYYVRGREVRKSLSSGMRRMHFALMSLRLADSAPMRRMLADFSTEWLAMDAELFDEGLKEREERGMLMRALEDRLCEDKPLTMNDLEELAGVHSKEELVEALKELIAQREAADDDDGTISSMSLMQSCATITSSADNTVISVRNEKALLEQLITAFEGVSSGNQSWEGREVVPRGPNRGFMPSLTEEDDALRSSSAGGQSHPPGCRYSTCEFRAARKKLDVRNERGGGGVAGMDSPDPLQHFSRLASDMQRGSGRGGGGVSGVGGGVGGGGGSNNGQNRQSLRSQSQMGMGQDQQGKVRLTSVLAMPEEFATHEDEFSVFNPTFPPSQETARTAAAEKRSKKADEKEDEDYGEYEEDSYVSEEEEPDDEDCLIFRCRVIRRCTTHNCLDAGYRSSARISSRSRSKSPSRVMSRSRSADRISELAKGTEPTFDEYVLRLPWDADLGELKSRISNACGIHRTQLVLCGAKEVSLSHRRRSEDAYSDDEGTAAMQNVELTPPLSDNHKSCLTLIDQIGKDRDDHSVAGAEEAVVVAFESSIKPRPGGKTKRGKNDGVVVDEEEDDDLALESLRSYGDKDECRLYDTDPLPLARAISRNLCPRAVDEFKIGLRVDALDHRGHWAAGSVVEIVESVEDGEGEGRRRAYDDENDEGEGEGGSGSSDGADGPVAGSRRTSHSESTKVRGHGKPGGVGKTKKTTAVRIHFDGSSRWRDKFYTIEDFTKRGSRGKKVGPLGRFAEPFSTPIEFVVYHRCNFGGGGSVARGKKSDEGSVSIFGQPFYLQFHGEWSTARAGAHILAQAARFVKLPASTVRSSTKGRGEDNRALERSRKSLWQLVDELIDIDRKYMESAVRGLGRGRGQSAASSFDPTDLSNDLRKKLMALLPRLPFKVRVCRCDAILGQAKGRTSKEVSFPFSLRRTVGNYMKDQHVLVLHWNKVSESSLGKSSSDRRTVLYSAPSYVLREEPNPKPASQRSVRGSKKSDERKNKGGFDDSIPDDGSMTVWQMPVATR